MRIYAILFVALLPAAVVLALSTAHAVGPTCNPACVPPLVCKSIVPPVGVPPKPGKGICLPP